MNRITETVLSSAVLDKTMRLFWAKGYGGAPIEEIVEATGFNRAAIYKRFGGKHELFLAMLSRYREHVTGQLLDPLRKSEGGIGALESFFEQFCHMPELTRESMGCMLVASASAASGLDSEVAKIVESYLDELRGLFQQALRQAHQRTELDDRVDIEAVADFLTGNVLGLMTLSRSGASPKAFHHHLDGIVHYIQGLRQEV